MNSSHIPGQGELIKVFQRLIADQRLPHAIVLHGRDGGVTLPLALYIVRALLCEQRINGEACGHCPKCVKTGSLTHPDVHFIYPVNTNKVVKKAEDRFSANFLSDWRHAVIANPYLKLQEWYKQIDIDNKQGFIGEYESTELRRALALRAFEAGYKVFIIWHADKMNITFANKMLKNLEEPTQKTLFILITESPSKLLSTIVSRVQIFREEHLDDSEMATFLQEQHQINESQALDIAFRTEGNINAAIYEAHNKGMPWLDEFRAWMRLSYSRDIIGLFKWSEDMAKNTRDAQKEFCSKALEILDRCYRIGWLNLQVPMQGEEAAFFKNFHQFINAANIAGFLEILEKASDHIERNVNEKLVWFESGIDAVRLIHEGKKVMAD